MWKIGILAFAVLLSGCSLTQSTLTHPVPPVYDEEAAKSATAVREIIGEFSENTMHLVMAPVMIPLSLIILANKR